MAITTTTTTTTDDAKSNNSYEEIRKLRLQENKRRFEDLGISKLSKNLAEATQTPKKSEYHQKPRSRIATTEPVRRSSRARNPVSYKEEIGIGIEVPRFRKRSTSSLWQRYLVRPADEVKEASDEQRAYAFQAAEKFLSNLRSGFPSFIKSMRRSHVYSCFWMGLPNQFCNDHLPKIDLEMILEDTEGNEYNSRYLGEKKGLSGGWRAFALDHKLDDGDALIFQLTEPARFKIDIFRAHETEEAGNNLQVNKANQSSGLNSKKAKKLRKNADVNELDFQNLQEESEAIKVAEKVNTGVKRLTRSMKVTKDDASKVEETNEKKKTKKLAKVVESGVDSVPPKVQLDDGPNLRKNNASTKLFRRKRY